MQIKLKPKRFFYVVLLQPSIAPLHSYGNIAKLWNKNLKKKKVFDKLRFPLWQLHSGFEEVTHWRAATNSSSSVFLHLTDLVHAISSPRDYMVGYFWAHIIDTCCFEYTNALLHSLWKTTNTFELLSLIFECTHLLPPCCQAKKPQEISSLQACSSYSHSNCAFFQITWNRISWFEFSIFYFSISLSIF